MGRELKRVAMYFDWPLKKVWEGYLNPYYKFSKHCSSCKNGYSPIAQKFHDQWYGNDPDFDPVSYGARQIQPDDPAVIAFAKRNVMSTPKYYGVGQAAIDREAQRLWGHWRKQWSRHLIQADVDALLEAGRLCDFTRTPRVPEHHFVIAIRMAFHNTDSWLPEDNGYRPTADEVNRWSLQGFGHDACNQWVCIKARCAREGVPVECATCVGDVTVWFDPDMKALCDAWTEYEPPAGDGYQLWETTSEGSPISPVFGTLDELCEWAASNASTFGIARATAKQWREMLDDGFVYHKEGSNIFL